MNIKLGKRYKRKDQTEFDKQYRDAWRALKKHWEKGLRREVNNEYNFNRVAWEANHTNDNSTFHLTDLQ